MAITRTQTGAIKPKKYEHESLHSAGDTAPKKGASGKKIKKQGKGGGKGHKGQKSGIKSPAPVSEFDRDPTPQPKLVGSDHLDGNYFWPSVIFGSKEEKPLR